MSPDNSLICLSSCSAAYAKQKCTVSPSISLACFGSDQNCFKVSLSAFAPSRRWSPASVPTIWYFVRISLCRLFILSINSSTTSIRSWSAVGPCLQCNCAKVAIYCSFTGSGAGADADSNCSLQQRCRTAFATKGSIIWSAKSLDVRIDVQLNTSR